MTVLYYQLTDLLLNKYILFVTAESIFCHLTAVPVEMEKIFVGMCEA